jgi:hypothetical protein
VTACATTGGVCTPKAAAPSPARAEVCGCDGLTYWNDTVASNLAVNVRAAGACSAQTGVKCNSGFKCPSPGGGPTRSCNIDVGAGVKQCNGLGVAAPVCWVLPPACPAVAPAELLSLTCNGGGGNCLSYCEAVRGEKGFYKDTNGNCP